MAINITEKQFHLQTLNSSYVMDVIETGELRHVYYGKKLPKDAKLSHTNLAINFGESPTKERDMFYQNISREYPSYGRSDYREGTIHIQNSIHGDTIINLEYKDYRIENNAPELKGMPCVRNSSNHKAQTLIITMSDKSLNLEIDLYYIVLDESDVLTRFSVIKNQGNATLKILSALSLALDFRADKDFDLITFNGAWARERKTERKPISYGIHKVSSTHGNGSSSYHNPSVLLVKPTTTEFQGDAYLASLIYSGNHTMQVELNTFDNVRLMAGINPFDFDWTLEAGEQFTTPQAVICYSANGIGEVSKELHNFVQGRIVAPNWANHPRYVLMNNWEGTYFDFDETKVLEMAKVSKELGAELFVLDDGWFGHRDNDRTSLGDWFDDKRKLPNGIKGLSKKVSDMGIKFGLWFEPEMISEDSELFKNHSDWRIDCPRYKPCQGRNQYCLDLTNKDVVDYLYNAISKILRESDISYIKWDKNRNATDIMSKSLPINRQKEFTHRYMLGLYDLMGRLVAEFPNVLFESCASGGNRFDLGMLYYMAQTWTSDNTDAVQRLDIQWGTSMVYPLASMGSHVSACPSHQTGRTTPIEFRGAVAMFGSFGYELDPTKMSDTEKAMTKDQISAFKKYRKLIHSGDFYRLSDPDTNFCGWSVVSKNKEEALVMVAQVLVSANSISKKIVVRGLIEEALYSVEELGITAYGSELMSMGIWLPYAGDECVKTDLSCFCSWGGKRGGDPSYKDFTGMIFHVIKK